MWTTSGRSHRRCKRRPTGRSGRATASRAAIDLLSAAATLARLDQLGQGHLSLVITDFRVHAAPSSDGQAGDVFDWITFRGEACVPRKTRADITIWRNAARALMSPQARGERSWLDGRYYRGNLRPWLSHTRS